MVPDISKEHSSPRRKASMVESKVGQSRKVYEGFGCTDVTLKRGVVNLHPSFSSMERTEILSCSGMKDYAYSQPVELESLAVAPQSSAAAAAAVAVAVVVAAAAEPACFHCLLHGAPQYDPLKPAESPVEALVSPGDLHSA